MRPYKKIKLDLISNNSEPSEFPESDNNSVEVAGLGDNLSDHNSEPSEPDNGEDFLRLIDNNNLDNQRFNIHIDPEDINVFVMDDHPNQIIPNLQEITQTLHDGLRNPLNDSAIYDYIQALHNIDQETPLVVYPELINLDNYPGLSTIILDSVRNEGGEFIINENNLTANSINLILQGILGGLNAENPQFQGLQSLQISNNVSDVDNVAMNEESMNLLSTILLHQHSRINNLDITNNNLEPANLNILLGNIAQNPVQTANLQELDFSLNFINRASVPLLNRILNNHNILIGGENSVPRDVELGNLPNNQHDNFTPGFEPTPANIISGSGATSLYSTFNSNAPAA